MTDIIYTEQNIIHLCIKNPTLFSLIDKEYFLSDTAKSVVDSIDTLIKSGKSLTRRNLIIDLNKNDVNIKEEHLDSIYDLDIPSSEFESYYTDLKKAYVFHKVREIVLPEILKESSKRSDADIDRVLSLAEDALKLKDIIHEKDSYVLNAKDMIKEYINVLYKRQSSSVRYETGCSFLDAALTERFAPGRITIVFGPSGNGKTTFVRHLFNLHLNKQIPAAYFTLEMSFEATMDNLYASRLDIPVNDFYPDHLEESEVLSQDIINKVENDVYKFSSSDIFRLVTKTNFSLDELRSMIRQFKKEMGVESFTTFIDLLTMIKDFNLKSGNKASNYEDAMNTLHYIALEENVHIVGVVQNKRPDSRTNVTSIDDIERFRPHIEELKNSGAIEERARVVLGVFRPKHFALRHIPDDPEVQVMDDIMEVLVLKQNMGAVGSVVKYLFHPEKNKLYKFIEPEHDDAPVEEEEDN